MIKNPSFEGLTRPGGWTRDTHTGQEYGEIFTPEGWVTWWAEGDYRRPEVKVIPKQAPFLDPLRIYDGDWGVQAFTFYGRMHAGLYQVISDLKPGKKYELSAHAHAWSTHTGMPHANDPHCSAGVGCGPVYISEGEAPPLNGDPVNDAIGNFLFRVGVSFGSPDPFSGVTWGAGAHIYNGFFQTPKLQFVAPENGQVIVYLKAKSLWTFKTSDAYWGLVELKELASEDCWGKPREQYDRTYVLIPQNYKSEWAEAAARGGYAKRFTVGYSADDAGIGMLDNKTVLAVNPEEWGDLESFYKQYYPKAKYTPLVAETPEILEQKLKGEPPPPPPPPPPTGSPIGLHLQSMVEGALDYVARVKPRVMKIFQLENAKAIKAANPDTLVVLRYFTEHQDLSGDLKKAARDYVATFKDSLITNADSIDFCESYNELIATHDIDGIKRSVEFDCHFADELMALGLPVAPLLLTAAVGNPYHKDGEIELLLPAVRKVVQYKGVVGYHGYWYSTPTEGGPNADWGYFAGRWCEWDKVFNSHGLYPRYVLGESGAVGAIRHPDGSLQLLPLDGWKSDHGCEHDWNRYKQQIKDMTQRIEAWNSTHNNRCLGLTLFTLGSFGSWESFELKAEELKDL